VVLTDADFVRREPIHEPLLPMPDGYRSHSPDVPVDLSSEQPDGFSPASEMPSWYLANDTASPADGLPLSGPSAWSNPTSQLPDQSSYMDYGVALPYLPAGSSSYAQPFDEASLFQPGSLSYAQPFDEASLFQPQAAFQADWNPAAFDNWQSYMSYSS
jgi:hypothetical protein